jgi:hypothetical protein
MTLGASTDAMLNTPACWCLNTELPAMETLFRVESVLQASEGTAFLNHGATESAIYYAFMGKPVPDFLNGDRHR